MPTDADKPRTATERKADQRKRFAEAGYVLLPEKDAWVHKEDLSRVLKYLRLLRARHEKAAKATK
jgi:hypothetical protein